MAEMALTHPFCGSTVQGTVFVREGDGKIVPEVEAAVFIKGDFCISAFFKPLFFHYSPVLPKNHLFVRLPLYGEIRGVFLPSKVLDSIIAIGDIFFQKIPDFLLLFGADSNAVSGIVDQVVFMGKVFSCPASTQSLIFPLWGQPSSMSKGRSFGIVAKMETVSGGSRILEKERIADTCWAYLRILSWRNFLHSGYRTRALSLVMPRFLHFSIFQDP